MTIKAISNELNDFFFSSFKPNVTKLSDFENHFNHIAKNKKVSFLDAVFFPDEYECSLFHYLLVEDETKIIEELIVKHKASIKKLPPSIWEEVFYLEQHSINSFKQITDKHLGTDYFNQIFSKSNQKIHNYSMAAKFLLLPPNELEKFYTNLKPEKIVNIKNFEFDRDASLFDLFSLLIFQPEKTMSCLMSKPNIIKELIQKEKTSEENKKLKNLAFPSEKTLKHLISSFGSNSVSQAINLYLKNLIGTSNKTLHLNPTIIRHCFEEGLDLYPSLNYILPTIGRETSLLCYLICTDKLQKKDLLTFINQPNLKIKAHQHILEAQTLPPISGKNKTSSKLKL